MTCPYEGTCGALSIVFGRQSRQPVGIPTRKPLTGENLMAQPSVL